MPRTGAESKTEGTQDVPWWHLHRAAFQNKIQNSWAIAQTVGCLPKQALGSMPWTTETQWQCMPIIPTLRIWKKKQYSCLQSKLKASLSLVRYCLKNKWTNTGRFGIEKKNYVEKKTVVRMGWESHLPQNNSAPHDRQYSKQGDNTHLGLGEVPKANSPENSDWKPKGMTNQQMVQCEQKMSAGKTEEETVNRHSQQKIVYQSRDRRKYECARLQPTLI